MDIPAGDFFKVGGTLNADAPSYVTRQADEELMQAVLSGQYCNVLVARQMGKSSLMVRTVRRLRDEKARTVMIDLTSVGTRLSASEWYIGLISHFKRDLRLAVDEIAWWNKRRQLGPVQRFSDFLRRVVLEEIREPVVVFIDEIDSTLHLPFSDDFFAAVRAVYNARASNPIYERLTFVLLGVASPSDLIKARDRTPYNIGTSIDIRDFTAGEARVLLAGLETAYTGQAEDILKRVLYWTDGHPYLTQKMCAEVVVGDGRWPDARIDELVKRLFLAEDSRKETNLQFIRDWILESDSRAQMLEVYRQVLGGRRVIDEERSPVKSRLKLTGLLKATSSGELIVRNRIYDRVFDAEWISEHTLVSPVPDDRGKEAAPMSPVWWVVIAVIVLIILVLCYYVLQGGTR